MGGGGGGGGGGGAEPRVAVTDPVMVTADAIVQLPWMPLCTRLIGSVSVKFRVVQSEETEPVKNPLRTPAKAPPHDALLKRGKFQEA